MARKLTHAATFYIDFSSSRLFSHTEHRSIVPPVSMTDNTHIMKKEDQIGTGLIKTGIPFRYFAYCVSR
jgi:hypothetical protein